MSQTSKEAAANNVDITMHKKGGETSKRREKVPRDMSEILYSGE